MTRTCFPFATKSIIVAVMAAASTMASAASITWNNTGTNFNAGSSWSGGTPPGSADAAFFSVSGTTNASAGALPSIGTSVTLQQLRFNATTANGYTLSAAAGQSLTLTSVGTGTSIATGAALVSVINSGTNTISAPIILGVAAGGTQAFTQTANGTLLITGNVTESGAGTTLSLSGGSSGYLRLSGTTTVTGGVNITGGRVDFTGPNALSGGVNLSGNSSLLLSTTAATLGAASNVITNVSGSNTLYLATANLTLPNSIVVSENSYLRLWAGLPGGVAANTAATGTITINAGGVLQTDKGSGDGYTFLGNNGASPLIFGANSGTATALLLNGFNSGARTHFGGLQTSTVVGDGPRITNQATASNLLDFRVSVAGGTSYTFDGSIQDNTLVSTRFTKGGEGTQAFGGNNTYTGTTSITGGVLRLNSANALPGGTGTSGGTSHLTLAGGVVGLGNGNFLRATGTTANAVLISTGGGFAAYTADRVVNLGGAGATLTWGTNSFMTTATGTFVLGAADADRTVDFQNPLVLVSTATSTSRTIRVNRGSADVDAVLSGLLSQSSGTAGVVKTGNGVLSLANSGNSFAGRLQIADGVVQIAAINNSGASPLGTNTTTELGAGATSGTLRWVGATSATTSRVFSLAGSSGGGGIDASGDGAFVLSSAVTANAGTQSLTLTGTSTALNTVNTISGTGVSVVKDGTGLWRLNAAKGFGGTLTVRNGTLLVASSGAAGSTVAIGDTAADASGVAALLLEQDQSASPDFDVLASAGTQAVRIGGANTTGTATFSSGEIRMSRDVALVAATGGSVVFENSTWAGALPGSPADRNVRVGADGFAGRVLFNTSGTLATTGTVAVQYGTAVIGPDTHVDSAGTLATAAGATLAGTGFVTGAIGGAGVVSPGNSPGILTAGSVDPSAATDFIFEITGVAPNFATPAASTNDVLRLTDATSPFAAALGAGNVVNVLFNLASGTAPVAQGAYSAGFFTDRNVDFSASIASGSFAYWVLGSYGSAGDQQQFSVGADGAFVTYSRIGAFDSALTVTPTVVPQTGAVTGQITQFVVVPEPGTIALLGIGIGVAAALRCRQRRWS